MIRRTDPTTPSRSSGTADRSRHRSGAVARMLRMPVATLRVWERRYGLTQPELTPSGQRLYSADDVRRLALIRQLTDLGHAIGSLAALDMAQLRQVAATHARTLAGAQVSGDAEPSGMATMRPWRLALIGAAFCTRLERPAVQRRLTRPLVLLGPFDDAVQAAAALDAAAVDTVLIHAPRLHDGWLGSIDAAAPALADVPKAVLYRYAPEAVCDALAAAGTALLRDPQPDAVLAQWLSLLAMTAAPASPLASPAPPAEVDGPVAPRRWDDAAIADFAGLSSTVACECPRHVAELLVQLSQFEAYSAECEARSTADAELHAYLGQVAGGSRARFEAALERVARHEGLLMPDDRARGQAGD